MKLLQSLVLWQHKPPFLRPAYHSADAGLKASVVNKRYLLFNFNYWLILLPGLIDELCDLDDVIPSGQKQLKKLAAVPSTAFATNKRIFREKALQRLRDNRELDIQNFVNIVQKPQTQKAIEKYLENLRRK